MGDSADLSTKCGRSCFVQLRRLTNEEIAKYTTSGGVDTTEGNLNSLQYSIPTKHSLRDVSRVKSEMFDSYKRSREKFLNRRSRQSSTEMTDFNVISGDEFSEPSEEEYRNLRAHKRKRLAYEDDLEWSPNTDGKYNLIEKRPITRPRKIGLRVNTRRKRIESNSSSSSDEDSFYYQQAEYQTKSDTEKTLTSNGDILNKSNTPISSLKKKASDSSNSKKSAPKISRDSSPLIDTDLLSKIMHEMSDYNMKNSKPGNKSNENVGMEKSNVDHSNTEISHYPPVKKRQSHLFKITDEDVTPRLTSVQQIVRKMVNHVCSSERRRLLGASGGSRKKICKWCDVPISPITTSSNNNVDSDLCTKCRSVSKDSKISNKNPNKMKILGGEIGPKPKSGNKIKNKLYKKLPKYDQQRLAYSGQADKSSVSKGYNHCKSFVTPKDLDASAIAEKTIVIKSSEKVKLKKKTKDSLKKNTKDSVNPLLNSKLKKKKKLLSTSEEKIDETKLKLKNLVSSAINKAVGEKKQKQVSVTNIDKGLFLMTFPEPHQELEIPPNESNALSVNDKNIEKAASGVTSQNQADLLQNKLKQPVTNNVQYGNYLLPPVPTVVVANYAATDAKSGDYYLSSVYYQNEMTRSKNAPLKNESIMTVTTAGSLPSMPSLDQLSTVSPPAFRFPQASHLHSLPVTDFSLPPGINSNIFPPTCHLNSAPKTDFSLPLNINTSNTVLLQSHVISPTNISIPAYSSQDNVNDFKIASEVPSTSYQTSIESDISSILSNPELQIQSLQSKDSDSDFNLFDNQELDLADSYEDNSNLTTENCNEDLGEIINNSVNETLHAASFDNDSEMPAKQSDSNENIETDQNKVPEQNADFSQSSTVDGNSSEGSFFYQSEAEIFSSETSLEDCCAELDAICILGLVDIEKNPKWMLKRRIDFNDSELEKVKSAETQDSTTQAKLRYLELHGRTLQIANLLLNKFGSFTRLSDTILRKQRLLQIKKEKGLELEQARSSCQFANSVPPPPPPPPILQNDSITTAEKMPSAVELKMENVQSCEFASRLAEPINHIEKIQTQIQSIQGNSSVTIDQGQLGLVHHFPAPDMPVASNATLSIAPRTEIMSEFRETPSRGSGPRTPARPESAMSQNDEGVLTPQQIKKEQFEVISSPLSQCAFSQNTTPSPRIPTSTPNTSQISPVSSLALVSVSNQLVTALGNQRHRAIAPTLSINNNSQIQKVVQQHTVSSAVSINSNNLQIQKVMQMHQGQVGPPNVTVPFPTGNQNFAKVVVNKPPAPPNIMPNLNTNPSTANVIVRGNYMNVQPVNVPGTTGGQLFQRFVQSSVPTINSNMNSYTYKQTMNSGGTMLVNSIGQNYALANSQVLNQQQVSRVYNTGNVQQPVQVSNSVNQAPPNATYLMPNSKVLFFEIQRS